LRHTPGQARHVQESEHLQDTSDIRIVGFDEKRPPRAGKEPYIDLFFKLSRQAPEDWCEDFNRLTDKLEPTIRIDKKTGLFIDTYVRDMEHIPAHLGKLKEKVATCNAQYLEKARQRALLEAARIASQQGEGGRQGRLNLIVAGLNFDD
jgi:hypothetical protein